VRLRPILGVETELDLEPAIEERHDCHHPCIDGLRLEAIVLQFVLVFENILAAVFVRELFSDESDEIAEVLALGLHRPGGSAGEFQVGEVCVYFVADDLSSAELDHTRLSDGRGSQIPTREPFVFHLIEPQKALALGL
jgi:hypothetical protein